MLLSVLMNRSYFKRHILKKRMKNTKKNWYIKRNDERKLMYQ